MVSKAALPCRRSWPHAGVVHRDARGSGPLARLAAAAQMRRRSGVIGAEPAEVDDLSHTCARGLVCDRLRCRAILLLEVARRASGRGSRPRPAPSRAAATPSPLAASATSQQAMGSSRAVRETAVSSCSASRGTSA